MSYPYLRPRFKIYPGEGKDIAVAVTVLTLSFFLVISPLPFHITSSLFDILYLLLVSLLAVITAFFTHEMAHKYMAIKYGYPAAFKKWNMGLLLALISSFFGFIFAAPGAVYIYGYPSRRENGIISSAGPATNLIVGFVLLTLSYFTGHLLYISLRYIAQLNFFISFFNLLPIPPMDGIKILGWRIDIYALLIILSLAGLVFTYL